MNYVEQIKYEKLRERAKESNRARIDSDGFSYQRFENGGNGKFHGGKRKSKHFSSNTMDLRFNKDKGFYPKVQGTLGAQATPNCKKCGKPHKRECLADFDAFLSVENIVITPTIV